MDDATEPLKPLCFDCLTEVVTVKVIDLAGLEHWFCAADWAAQQEFHGRLMDFLTEGLRAMELETRVATDALGQDWALTEPWAQDTTDATPTLRAGSVIEVSDPA